MATTAAVAPPRCVRQPGTSSISPFVVCEGREREREREREKEIERSRKKGSRGHGGHAGKVKRKGGLTAAIRH